MKKDEKYDFSNVDHLAARAPSFLKNEVDFKALGVSKKEEVGSFTGIELVFQRFNNDHVFKNMTGSESRPS